MIFTLRRPTIAQTITLKDISIPWKRNDECVKYLGVYLDRRLTWKYHINSKVNLAYSRLRHLYPLLNRKSSLRFQCGSLIYKSLLRPLLTYACPVWGGATPSTIRRLQTFQNKVLRIILNAPWFIRTTQLHRELGFNTIPQHISALAHSFYQQLHRVPGATHFSLGKRSTEPLRIKSRLPQDLLLSTVNEDSLSDEN